ncbi:hypothetical protein GCM10027169_03550 [Gordonia jinhuaensis]|uniref:Uncharacterized protein n=1 Tax=Gordonia jinhuaensis TaxID=1517702 RepID=A0A916WMI3_9ACTN|nr:hypothetical protein GCM10011489_00500 [Gordonia jinhuaensis]
MAAGAVAVRAEAPEPSRVTVALPEAALVAGLSVGPPDAGLLALLDGESVVPFAGALCADWGAADVGAADFGAALWGAALFGALPLPFVLPEAALPLPLVEGLSTVAVAVADAVVAPAVPG